MSFIHEIRENDDPTSNRACRTQCGTPKYMAPEMITTARAGYNGAKIDAWDCGLILYAMLAGFLPFNGSDDRQVFRQIVFHRINYPHWFDPELCDLLGHLLEKDPDLRWSVEEVRNHKWFCVGYEGDVHYKNAMAEVREERRQRAERVRAERGRGLHHSKHAGSISRPEKSKPPSPLPTSLSSRCSSPRPHCPIRPMLGVSMVPGRALVVPHVSTPVLSVFLRRFVHFGRSFTVEIGACTEPDAGTSSIAGAIERARWGCRRWKGRRGRSTTFGGGESIDGQPRFADGACGSVGVYSHNRFQCGSSFGTIPPAP